MARPIRGTIGSGPEEFEKAFRTGAEMVFTNTDRIDAAGNVEVWIDENKWLISEDDLEEFIEWASEEQEVEIIIVDYKGLDAVKRIRLKRLRNIVIHGK